jgi:hypothetical protein
MMKHRPRVPSAGGGLAALRSAGSVAVSIRAADFARVGSIAGVIALTLVLAGCGASRGSQKPASPGKWHVGVLRMPRTQGDQIPARVAHALLRGRLPIDARDLQAARRVFRTPGGWLLPGSQGGLCLVRIVDPLVRGSDGGPLPSSSRVECATQEGVDAGRLFETQSLSPALVSRPPTRVSGITPDGVNSVKVSAGDKTKIVRVIRNAYSAIARAPTSLSFVITRAGKRSRRFIQLPSVGTISPRPNGSNRVPKTGSMGPIAPG